jgi:5-(carboxyamino)imidazole ribonucleotide mutase
MVNHKSEEAAMQPLVSVLMGSKSDWEAMKPSADLLDKLGIPCEVRVLSAHRTPDQLFDYLKDAEGRGAEVFIAAAGGAAHLAGVVAAKTLKPVLAVPMESKLLGLDSLLSMVQMPAGIPVATFAIGKAGASNAALFAAAILAIKQPKYHEALRKYRDDQAQAVLAVGDPRS